VITISLCMIVKNEDAGGIVNLQARDRVEVFATVFEKNVEIQSGVNTRFEGARIS